MGFITFFGIQAISGCFTFTSLLGFAGGLVLRVRVSGPGCRGRTAGPTILRQAVPGPPVNAQGPTPSCEDSLEPKGWRLRAPSSQKPVLTFGNFGSCTIGLLPRPEICIKRLRKIYPKINMKAKTSCQELQPHTSCWLPHLCLSSQFWFFQTKRKPASMSWTLCLRQGLTPLSSSFSAERRSDSNPEREWSY